MLYKEDSHWCKEVSFMSLRSLFFFHILLCLLRDFTLLSFVLAFLLLHPLFFCLRCLPFPPGSTCTHDTKSQSCFKPHQDVPTWHGSPIHSSLCLLSCRWHSVALRPAAVPWSRDWVDRSWVHATSAATVHSSYDVHAQIMKKHDSSLSGAVTMASPCKLTMVL